MGRARLWMRRALLGASVLCVALSAAVPGSGAQEADDGPRPEVFRGVASSLVASVEGDRAALLPIPEVFRFIALDGSGTYESSNQEGRASLLFPGNGLILGPGLVCGTFGAEFPDDFKPIFDQCNQYKYPLTVYADAFEPEGATSGALALGSKSDPISGNAVGARAVANEHGVITDAAMQDLRLLGLPAFGPVRPPIPGFEFDGSILTIDSATSRTEQRLVEGALVVDAEATLSGVRMIGGLVRIGSIRSAAHVTDDAGQQVTETTFEVSGVTVAGQPAQITDKGLVLDPSGGGSGPLAQSVQSQANELLKAFAIRVTTLEAEEGVDDRSGGAFATVGGLLIEFEQDVQGLPLAPGPMGDIDPNGVYTGSIQLGSTAALGVVPVIPDDAETAEVSEDVGGGGDLGLPAEPVSDLGSGSGSADSSGLPAVAGDPLETPTGGGGEQAAAVTQEQVVGFVDELFADRMRLLYLAFTLAALALCVAPRLTLPARLPASRP